MPAIGDGQKCPDKKNKDNRELYLEKLDCSDQDCERKNIMNNDQTFIICCRLQSKPLVILVWM